MTEVIDSFRGQYFCFSNFWEEPVLWKSKEWPSAEHAFQAEKFFDEEYKEKIRLAPKPNKAKAMGKTRRIPIRPDWEQVKEGIMEAIVYEKFSRNNVIKAELLATGDALLLEGNTWHDAEWGVVRGTDGKWRGNNKLGKALMRVRDRLRAGA
jgi:ribA/ribD-fused uncharacterized protein